tara:strand:- start:388 stop:633 length:246 start_codon:yes stop_codon:yes gene_type:complete
MDLAGMLSVPSSTGHLQQSLKDQKIHYFCNKIPLNGLLHVWNRYTAYRNQLQKENQKILQKVTKLRELCRNPHLFALIRIK